MVRYILDENESVQKIELSKDEWRRIEVELPYSIGNNQTIRIQTDGTLYIDNVPQPKGRIIGSNDHIAKKIEKNNKICIIISGQYGHMDESLVTMIKRILG